MSITKHKNDKLAESVCEVKDLPGKRDGVLELVSYVSEPS